jgi:hypothetical protein
VTPGGPPPAASTASLNSTWENNSARQANVIARFEPSVHLRALGCIIPGWIFLRGGARRRCGARRRRAQASNSGRSTRRGRRPRAACAQSVPRYFAPRRSPQSTCVAVQVTTRWHAAAAVRSDALASRRAAAAAPYSNAARPSQPVLTLHVTTCVSAGRRHARGCGHVGVRNGTVTRCKRE